MLSRGLCQITNTILSGEAKQEIRGIALGGSKICKPAFKNKGGPFCNNLSLKAVGPFVAAFLCFLTGRYPLGENCIPAMSTKRRLYSSLLLLSILHRKKRFLIFLSQAWMSLTKLSLGRNNFYMMS
jgi:hypothetical protein